MTEINVGPRGDLAIRTMAMPADANASGDIFGGWLLSQMDLAGSVAAGKVARGRTARGDHDQEIALGGEVARRGQVAPAQNIIRQPTFYS